MQLAGQGVILVLCAQTTECVSLPKPHRLKPSSPSEKQGPEVWLMTLVIRKLATDLLVSVGLLCSAKKGRQYPFTVMGSVCCLPCSSFLWETDLF